MGCLFSIQQQIDANVIFFSFSLLLLMAKNPSRLSHSNMPALLLNLLVLRKCKIASCAHRIHHLNDWYAKILASKSAFERPGVRSTMNQRLKN